MRSDLKQRFNIVPGQNAPVIAAKEDGNSLAMFRWGLIPSWAKEAKIGYKMINARSECITEKPTFKRLVGKRHCLVLANGFFEWRKEGNKKVPLHLKLKSGRVSLFPSYGIPGGRPAAILSIPTGCSRPRRMNWSSRSMTGCR